MRQPTVTPSPTLSRVLTPFREFARTEAAGGILLIAAAAMAFVWANSPWSESYFDLWHTDISITVGSRSLSEDLGHWINDGLMAVFFFVVGLEIKREVLVGELSSPRQAALPIVAAAGGALAPAAIFLLLNAGSDGSRGWGVPMATDIAFALGVMALLGDRVPAGLKVFLAAMAIVDDIIAVLVIALFYTDEIDAPYLLAGLGILALLIGMNWLGVSLPLAYALVGVVLWVAFIQSGIHATVAGVLLAMTIPARTRIDVDEFLERSRATLEELEAAGQHGHGRMTNKDQQSALQDLESAAEHVQTPMQRLEDVLHPWVAFGIVPLFALANAGVEIRSDVLDVLASPVSLGIIAGLVLGKQLGITLSAWLLLRLGLADLPQGAGLRHFYGVSWLAGIGFTMSLFIADLAFVDAASLNEAKIGILAASLVAGLGGWLVLSAIDRISFGDA